MTRQEWIVLAITAGVLIDVFLYFTPPWWIRELSWRRPGHPSGSRTEAAFSNASVAIGAYHADHGRYPNALHHLLVPDDYPYSPYLHDRWPLLDSWGTEIRFENRTNGYTLISAGPDHSFGTGDDIVKAKGTPNPASEASGAETAPQHPR